MPTEKTQKRSRTKIENKPKQNHPKPNKPKKHNKQTMKAG